MFILLLRYLWSTAKCWWSSNTSKTAFCGVVATVPYSYLIEVAIWHIIFIFFVLPCVRNSFPQLLSCKMMNLPSFLILWVLSFGSCFLYELIQLQQLCLMQLYVVCSYKWLKLYFENKIILKKKPLWCNKGTCVLYNVIAENG